MRKSKKAFLVYLFLTLIPVVSLFLFEETEPHFVFESREQFVLINEVHLENQSGFRNENIRVLVPMPKSSSFYQSEFFLESNYPLVEVEGRIGTFDLGNLEPNQSKMLIIKHRVNITTFQLKGRDEKLREIEKIYSTCSGEGNCLVNSIALQEKLDFAGFQTRIAYGFATTNRESFTNSSLTGLRHAWLEVFLDDLGWIPIDITFDYFAHMPKASHMIESYESLPIRIFFTGGTVTGTFQYRIEDFNSD